MKNKQKSDIVPLQQTGKAIDTKSSFELQDENDAIAFFPEVKKRLENVNHWKDVAGALSATFQLVDENGVDTQRPPRKGDYFKIDIPGPGSQSGEGYDWVRVEEIEDSTSSDSERFGFRVRPAQNPLGSQRDIAHFYSDESTSSFIVERTNNKITASVYDRNTKPNTEADSTTDKIRDAVVGVAGVVSFSKIQWKSLTDGLIKR